MGFFGLRGHTLGAGHGHTYLSMPVEDTPHTMSAATPSTKKRKYRMLFKNGEIIVSGYLVRCPKITIHSCVYDDAEKARKVKVISSPTRNYGYCSYGDLCLQRRGFQVALHRIYMRLNQEVQDEPVESQSPIWGRSCQVLHFYAHTIQLLFRRNVERKCTKRALAIEY